MIPQPDGKPAWRSLLPFVEPHVEGFQMGTYASAKQEGVTGRVQDWLSYFDLGEINPFESWDASQDPDLSRYVCPHGLLEALWEDTPAIIYAPRGGGKSAFRARLAYACRVGYMETARTARKVVAIPYTNPEASSTSLNAHLEAILRKAAQELLLTLVNRPALFLDLGEEERQAVHRALEENSPGLLARFLDQVEEAGGIAPLAETHDRSAAHLPSRHDPEAVSALCRGLRAFSRKGRIPGAEQRFEDLRNLLLDVLGFEEIYLLVDGIDARTMLSADAARAREVLDPLLAGMAPWAEQRIFLKLFLPIKLREVLPKGLTKSANSYTIEWNRDSLTEVLRARLRAASRGSFDSLERIFDHSLEDVQSELLDAVPPNPRELLVLMNRVIVEHVWRNGKSYRLTPEDLWAAIRWYRSQQQAAPL